MNITKKIPVIIDCDTGVDDALALCVAFKASYFLDVRAVTCVCGNGPIDTVLQATLKVMDACDVASDLPVSKGFERPLIEKNKFCPEIHGHDCLGDLKPPLPMSNRRISDKHATQLILDVLSESKEDVVIMAFAPLTNIAVAMRINPQLFRSKVKRIFWMGGSMTCGNYSAVAEANAACDPEATHMVFSSGIPITMFTWDAYLKIEFTRHDLHSMGISDKNIEGNSLDQAQDLCARLLYREMRIWKKDTAVIGDAVIVVLLLGGYDLFRTQRYHVQVELAPSHTRGMTIVDRRSFVDPPDLKRQEPNIEVVSAISVTKIKHLFASIVFGMGREENLGKSEQWTSL